MKAPTAEILNNLDALIIRNESLDIKDILCIAETIRGDILKQVNPQKDILLEPYIHKLNNHYEAAICEASTSNSFSNQDYWRIALKIQGIFVSREIGKMKLGLFGKSKVDLEKTAEFVERKYKPFYDAFEAFDWKKFNIQYTSDSHNEALHVDLFTRTFDRNGALKSYTGLSVNLCAPGVLQDVEEWQKLIRLPYARR